jgi:hypothetical protein
LTIPLTGESFPRGGAYTVELSWVGAGDPPRVAADASGRPALSVIRPEDDGLRIVHAEGAVIWERLDVIPRIHWASATEVIPSARDRIDAMASGDTPGDTVILDRPGGPADGRPATLDVLEDSGDRVRVRVDAEGAGYLVLAESVQVDWTATVDGSEAEIVDADHAFGAVRVPPGEHEITLAYTPRGATAGLLASGFGGFLVLLLAVLPLRPRRRGVGA